MIRILDVIISLVGIILLAPLFIIAAIWIKLDSPGTVIFSQSRVGRYGIPFNMFKFRSMAGGADRSGLLTIGETDNRITRSGAFLRRYKIDELPQLFNVLIGDMSIVGPRPEVQRFVNIYTHEQQKILSVRPGITDMASIVYSNESDILSRQANPEQYYIDCIMPEKIRLNQVFISSPGVSNYFRIIFLTIKKIIKG